LCKCFSQDCKSILDYRDRKNKPFRKLSTSSSQESTWEKVVIAEGIKSLITMRRGRRAEGGLNSRPQTDFKSVIWTHVYDVKSCKWLKFIDP
jgi:hypothetical protein